MSKLLDPSILLGIEEQILSSNYEAAILKCTGLEPSPPILFLKAKALVGARKFTEALNTISSAIAAESSIADYHSLKAQILIYIGRYQDSLSEAQTAIALNPSDIGAYVFKGQALKHLHYDQEAIEIFREGVRVVETTHHSRDVKLDLEKAFLARSCQEYDHGIRYSNYVITAAPLYSSGYIHLGFNLLLKYISNRASSTPNHEKLLSDATIELDHALSINPTDSVAIYYKAIALEISGKVEEALAAHNRAIGLEPHNPMLYSAKASTMSKLHKEEGL